jgi:hypothetical protein
MKPAKKRLVVSPAAHLWPVCEQRACLCLSHSSVCLGTGSLTRAYLWYGIVNKAQPFPLCWTSLNPVPNAQVCVYLKNYNYKLHFQNLSIYHIPHVSIGTLAPENLDVCTDCDPWDGNIQLTMVKDRRPGPGMPFLDSDTFAEGGVIYFCQGFLPYMMPFMDGWRDGWMDGKSFTTSFTIMLGKALGEPLTMGELGDAPNIMGKGWDHSMTFILRSEVADLTIFKNHIQ